MPADGTYKIQICEGPCESDSKAITGVLIIDASGASFSNQSDAMRSFMRHEGSPNYCYYFDPETSNSKDTMFAYDVVAFGVTSTEQHGKVLFQFQLRSPDFRYLSEVQPVDAQKFLGDWASYYANSSGITQPFAKVHLHAERISEPQADICIDAVRRFEHDSLKSYCIALPERSCETGDRP
jgi:hypothetical protein